MQDPARPDSPKPTHLDASSLINAPLHMIQRARSGITSFGKLALIGVLMGLLLIPVGMIRSLINEREMRRSEAESEVSGHWGGPQMVEGPILTVPYRTYSQGINGKVDTGISHARFLPEDLDVLGTLHPEVRHRGIFDVPLFQADLEFQGRFSQPSFAAWKVNPKDVLWDEAFLTVALPDLRALVDAEPVQWMGKGRSLSPDNLPGSPVAGGLEARVPLDAENPGGGGYGFKFKLRVRGSGTMRFLPMGKETKVAVRSTWSHPSFVGAYLPAVHSEDAAGFQANWKTLNLSRSFPQSWRDFEIGQKDWGGFGFGVELLLPVDRYQKTERCAKYAVLFILLTFLVFFLYETFDRSRIHPLQYLLVGFALCLFYLLLLSLAEHVSFNLAYAAATCGVVGMITAYGLAILSSRKRALGLGAMLAGLYAYLFTLLQMEDFALLMGSLGLFVILGSVMFLTRRINWYGAKEEAVAA